MYYCDFEISVTGIKYHLVKDSDITDTAHLEETPIIVLLDHMKLLLKPAAILCWEFHSIKQLVFDWVELHGGSYGRRKELYLENFTQYCP